MEGLLIVDCGIDRFDEEEASAHASLENSETAQMAWSSPKTSYAKTIVRFHAAEPA